MRFEVFWRVAVVQLVAIGLLAVVLAALFSHGFFVDWGWLVGPLAWLGCAALTARVVGLATGFTLLRAVLAGVVSLIGVAIGAHWLGIVVAVGLFAYLCAREPDPGILRP